MGSTNQKISLIIPFYDCDSGKKAELDRCLKSLEGMYDELVIIYQPKGHGLGFAGAVNMGYRYATGDFIIMCCDDVVLIEGNLRQLCDKDHVTCAQIAGRHHQDFWGTLWCTPRWVYEKTGPIPEEYSQGLYYEDNDYYMMVKEIVTPYTNIRVVIDHPKGGRTLETITDDRQAKIDHNKNLFESRWHTTPTIYGMNTQQRYG